MSREKHCVPRKYCQNVPFRPRSNARKNLTHASCCSSSGNQVAVTFDPDFVSLTVMLDVSSASLQTWLPARLRQIDCWCRIQPAFKPEQRCHGCMCISCCPFRDLVKPLGMSAKSPRLVMGFCGVYQFRPSWEFIYTFEPCSTEMKEKCAVRVKRTCGARNKVLKI